MITVIHHKRGSMLGHDAGWVLSVPIVVLASESGLRVESIVVNLLKRGFVRRILLIMFVGRITRPATRGGVELAHEKVAGPSVGGLTQNVANATFAVSFD